MHRLIFFKVVILVVLQHILLVFGQRPKTTNPCPHDFLRIHNRCYYFSSEDDTWQGAKVKCDDRNSTLAVINSVSQNNALKAFLKKEYTDANLPNSSRLQMSAPRWLGSQYDWIAAEWKWIYNGKIIPAHLCDKEKFQKKPWHCLTIDPNNNYSWSSDSCFEKNYYICQTKLSHRVNRANLNHSNNDNKKNPAPSNLRHNSTEQHVSDSQPGFYVITAENSVPAKGNEHKKAKKKKQKFICPKDFVLVGKKCYLFSREKTSWADAFYKCTDLHADLAILKNLQQDKRLRFKVNKFRLSNDASWIGGQYDFKNNLWKWAATGGVLPHQPYAPTHNQWACVLWDPNITDRWTSESCLKQMPYICQRSAKPADRKTAPKKPSKSKPNAHRSY